MTIHAQGKTQKRFEKTSSLYLRLMILSTETACNTPKKPIIKNQKTMGKRKNLISRATTLLDSNVQFLTTKKIKHTNKQESMTHSNEKKKLKINRNCP